MDLTTFLPIIATITVTLYAIVLFLYFRVKGDNFFSRDEREERKRFYRALKSGLQLGEIVTLKNIEDIYKGIKRESLEGFSYQRYLNVWLRDFNVDLISKNPILTKDDEDLKFDFANLKEYKPLIDKFIKELMKKLLRRITGCRT